MYSVPLHNVAYISNLNFQLYQIEWTPTDGLFYRWETYRLATDVFYLTLRF